MTERTHEIERRRAVAEGMRELLAVVNSQHTLDEILAYLVTQASRLLDSPASAIYMPEPADDQTLLAAKAFHGLDADYAAVKVPAGRAGPAWPSSSSRPVAVYDVAAAMPTSSERAVWSWTTAARTCASSNWPARSASPGAARR